MSASFLIALREGLEAALIVGIILGVLRRLGRSDYRWAVWTGVAAAVGLSVLGALGLNAMGVAFEGRAEEIFEGVTMLLAAGVLTWMIFWMQRQSKEIRSALETDVRRAVGSSDRGLLWGLAFVAVLREGIETALFLTAASFQAETWQVWVGALAGLAAAVALGWLIFVAGKRLNLRRFFAITGLLLLLFAAGLVARGVHELQEGGVLPIIVEHLWDSNHILDENGTVGVFLKTLLGYNGNPSLIEVVVYLLYLGVLGVVGWRPLRRVVPAPEAGTGTAAR